MSEQILRLCKRLNKFTLDEISLISESNEKELRPVLDEFISKNQLLLKDGVYFYNKPVISSKRTSKLPLMFQYHSPETIDMIIKCFCADIEVEKVVKILNPQQNTIKKFYKFLRECIYKKQLNDLLFNFQSNPKIGRPREYFDKMVYLYLYNNELFVSEKLLKSEVIKNYTNTERLLIKNLYLKSFRKAQNKAYKQYFHLHLAETICRNDSNYEKMLENMRILINC